jgi:putative membrane protein
MAQQNVRPQTSLREFIIIVIKGGMVGIANIIPGVSGGTFALILGIFDRIIDAISGLRLETGAVLFRFISSGFRGKGRDDFIAEWERLDVKFLVLLAVGAIGAIMSTSILVDYLLKVHYSPTLAFFVGLLLPSIAIPWAMMDRRGLVLLWIIPGVLLTFGVSFIIPDSVARSDNLLFALLTGAISISAMILPGLSGSYIMLIMGQYQNVLNKLTDLQRGLGAGQVDLSSVVWLASLAAGMAVGIVFFARFLNFLLARYRSATMAFLIGLLIGSLWVLWPFKEIVAGATIEDRHGEVKQEVQIATAPNCLPKNADEVLLAGSFFILGFTGSTGLIIVGKRPKTRRKNKEKG